MKKILLFDIDGTLLLTGGCGKIAIEKAFQELFGIENAWGDMMPDGKTDLLIIEEISKRTLNRSLNETENAKVSKRYLTYFRSEIQNAPDLSQGTFCKAEGPGHCYTLGRDASLQCPSEPSSWL